MSDTGQIGHTAHVVARSQRKAFRRAAWRPARIGWVFLPILVFVAAGCSPHRNRPSLPPGPYRTLDVEGAAAPFYLVNFDKDGRCESPVTLGRLVEDAASGDYTDIILISHGWNNDWATATGLYNDFLIHFEHL